MTGKFQSIEEMLAAVADMVRPPERLTVSQAAAKYRWINNPGSYVGPWKNETTPYMVEPMDVLASTDYTGMIFVGPAQAGKTDIIFNYMVYTAICDPADIMVIQMSQAAARDFSMRRVERFFRHTPAVGEKRLPGRHNQNTFDTRFSNGMLWTLSWPSITELSGKPVPRLWLTDFDRFPQNVDGEGNPYDLAKKRATVFGRYGMTVAESTPGFTVEDPKWIPHSPHEAPPTQGILALYNRGDRRRWFWKCPHCARPFEPDFHLLKWPHTSDHMEAAELAEMECPHCSRTIPHSRNEKDGIPGKYDLNLGGRWVKDGMQWLPDGSVVGTPRRADIASFWLKGVCAAFADWKTLVHNYLKALEEYEATGSEEALKTTVNTDQGLPYTPKSLGSNRLPEDLKSRADWETPLGEVPEGVRFLVASIDVQGRRFVVQVHGFGAAQGEVSSTGDMWVIDRFDIRYSDREDPAMPGQKLWVDPGAYPEDWLLVRDQVLTKTYPLADGSGRHMQIKAFVCDSGGREGVTKNAYDFWRWLRDHDRRDFHRRFLLAKGSSNISAPRIEVKYPDSSRRDRKAAARGEVPVLMINTTVLKDQVDKMLDRTDPGTGMIHFPDGLPDSFYMELTAEVRTSKGWENPKNRRNEAWDLLVYANAIALSHVVNIERIDWSKPPRWADEWNVNDLVSEAGQANRFEARVKSEYSLAELAESLA